MIVKEKDRKTHKIIVVEKDKQKRDTVRQKERDTERQKERDTERQSDKKTEK